MERHRHARASRLPTVLLVLGAVLGLAPGAMAASPQCGDTITQDTTLTSDLGPCPENGLVIGADNITLDLGSHTVTGQSGGVGVIVKDRRGVTVRNGTIKSLGTDVLLGRFTPSYIPDKTPTANRVLLLTLPDGVRDGRVFHFFPDPCYDPLNSGLEEGSGDLIAFNRVSAVELCGPSNEIAFNVGNTAIFLAGNFNRIEHNQLSTLSR
jgi:hypothetical protein